MALSMDTLSQLRKRADIGESRLQPTLRGHRSNCAEDRREVVASLDHAEITSRLDKWKNNAGDERRHKHLKSKNLMVGTGRFELPTPRTPSECSTRLSHVPTQSSRLTLEPALGVVLSLHEAGLACLHCVEIFTENRAVSSDRD